jgi:hypothetical protein
MGVHPSRSGLGLLPQAVAPRMQRPLWACMSLRPWVVAEGCGATNAEAAEGVDPRVAQALLHLCQAGCLRRSGVSLSVAGPAWWTKAVAPLVQGPLWACIRVAQALGCCRKLWRRECRGPCGRASESLRPWVVAKGCGAANAEAAEGVHPSRVGLGLLPGVGAGPEPDVLQARLDWPVSTLVSVAVPTSDALRLFLKVISAGPAASIPVSIAGPSGELQIQALGCCRRLWRHERSGS